MTRWLFACSVLEGLFLKYCHLLRFSWECLTQPSWQCWPNSWQMTRLFWSAGHYYGAFDSS